jgi:hypothetical protein
MGQSQSVARSRHLWLLACEMDMQTLHLYEAFSMFSIFMLAFLTLQWK